MIAVWPSELTPGTFVEGFSSGPRGTRLATPPDVGPPKMRPRGNLLRPIAFTDLFNANQLARFNRFWEEDLRKGVDPFLYPDPHANGFPLCDDTGAVLLNEAGRPLIIESWILCTFSTDQPSWAARPGGRWAPQFSIVELP